MPRTEAPPAAARAETNSEPTDRKPIHRQARGERRRKAILDATLRVINRDGVAGVTHRAVAAEAGVPLASTTYYFESKADLLRDAFRHHADRENEVSDDAAAHVIEQAAGGQPAVGDAIEEMVKVMVEAMIHRRGDLVASYELQLEASRRPELRELSQRWAQELTDRLADWFGKLGSTDPSRDAFIVLMMVTGIEVDMLTRLNDEVPVDDLRSSIGRLVRSLLAAPKTFPVG